MVKYMSLCTGLLNITTNNQVIMGTLKIKSYLGTVKVQKLATEVEPVKNFE